MSDDNTAENTAAADTAATAGSSVDKAKQVAGGAAKKAGEAAKKAGEKVPPQVKDAYGKVSDKATDVAKKATPVVKDSYEKASTKLKGFVKSDGSAETETGTGPGT